MSRILSILIRKIGGFCFRLSAALYQSPVERQVRAWHRVSGDKTLRLEYDLNEQSVVFDLGGYEGQWASDIFSRYGCSIFILEPISEFAEYIQNRFSKNPKIIVHKFGLSSETRTAKIAVMGDGSSIFKEGDDMREILLVRAADFFKENAISKLDLMKINIEGGEYDLLDHLIQTGFVGRVKNIQVQFHDFVDNAQARMRTIRQNLERSHELTYQYPFVWENWRKK